MPVSPLVREVVLTSDNGPEILYASGRTKPGGNERIMKLPVAQQGVALGMFMAKNGTVATQTTKAPDPVRSPRTGSGAVDPLSESWTSTHGGRTLKRSSTGTVVKDF